MPKKKEARSNGDAEEGWEGFGRDDELMTMMMRERRSRWQSMVRAVAPSKSMQETAPALAATSPSTSYLRLETVSWLSGLNFIEYSLWKAQNSHPSSRPSAEGRNRFEESEAMRVRIQGFIFERSCDHAELKHCEADLRRQHANIGSVAIISIVGLSIFFHRVSVWRWSDFDTRINDMDQMLNEMWIAGKRQR